MSSPRWYNPIPMFFFDYATLIDPLLKDIRIYLAKLSCIKSGDKVLDLCCGTGNQVFYYTKNGAIATGIDQNPNMIKTAERNKRRQGFNGVTFCTARADELPFRDSYFDCASISLALHEMKRTQQDSAIAGMKRVVKDGGILMFVDFKVPLPKNGIGYFIRSLEYLVGMDNFRCFRDYLNQGGLEPILKRNKLDAQVEALLMAGNIQIIKCCDLGAV